MNHNGISRATEAGSQPFALISKDRETKGEFIRWAASVALGGLVYVGPRNLISQVKSIAPSARVIAHEDFTKREVYLRLVSAIGPDTVLILENVARYTKLAAQRFTYLHRLRKMVGRVLWIDVVPFAEDITKLYLPYSYLDRQILKYAHGYAFEYNYMEEQPDGSLVRSHDLRYLANKVHPYTHITHGRFLPAITTRIDAPMTSAEHAAYQKRKRELIDKYSNPHRIVTYLCDWVNTRESRYDRLSELLADLHGAAVYTNINQNSTALVRAMKVRGVNMGNVDVRTYRSHASAPIEADGVVLFEAPIVNRYLLHDVLSDVLPESTCCVFRGDSKADQYIYGEMACELNTINKFTTALKEVQDESLSAEISA